MSVTVVIDMYRCNECDKEFEEPVKRAVLSGEFWGAPFTEYGDTCPYCKSEYISEIKYYCDCCNYKIAEGETYYETNDSSIFCEDCITKKEA